MTHRLLACQITRHLEGMDLADPRLRSFLQAVEQAYDSADQEKALLENALDLTSRELSDLNERQRRENAVFLRTVFDSLGDGLYVTDEKGRLVLLNRAVEEILDVRAEILLNSCMHEVAHHHHEDGRPYAVEDCPIARSYREGQGAEGRETLIARDGRFIPVSFVSRPLVQGDRLTGSVVSIRNMTEQDRLAAALQAQQAETRKLALIAARTDNAVILTDARGRIEWVNEGFVRLTGYALEEIRGRTPGEFLQGPETDPATVATMRSCLTRGEGFQVEIVNYAKDGRAYWLAIEVQPIRDEQGTITNFMAIESDITQRRKADAEIRRWNEHMAQELELAGVLQKTLLAVRPLHTDFLEARAAYRPSLEVGGDLLDLILLPDGRACFYLGDVSGHGVAPAILSSMLKGLLADLIQDSGDLEPATICNQLHRRFRKLIDDPSLFATFVLAIYDPVARELRCMNCGHPPPLMIDADRTDISSRFTGEGGLPIGVSFRPGDPYTTADESVVTIPDGATILFFTDGLVEARHRSSGEECTRDTAPVAPQGEEQIIAAVEGVRVLEGAVQMIVQVDPSERLFIRGRLDAGKGVFP